VDQSFWHVGFGIPCLSGFKSASPSGQKCVLRDSNSSRSNNTRSGRSFALPKEGYAASLALSTGFPHAKSRCLPTLFSMLAGGLRL
jgi:hypothetical protein